MNMLVQNERGIKPFKTNQLSKPCSDVHSCIRQMKIITGGETVAYLSVYPNEMENMYVAWEIKLIPSSNGTKLLTHQQWTLYLAYFIDDS